MDHEFARRLRELRSAKNMSINAVAREVGLSGQGLANYESGRVPKGDVLCRLAAFFSVDVDYLLTGKMSETQTIPAPTLTPGELHLLEVYRSMDRGGQAAVVRWMEFEARSAYRRSDGTDPEKRKGTGTDER